ncbi:MAG: molybdenum cofactor guanylyltransferase [Cytophagaceae bacterium]|nr:molybdenum cofactor guanylyltransferase [Gemmatimonadaceae bacterium]
MTAGAATERCVGVILAGGRASRFGGSPKGLGVVGGHRVIDRVAGALRGACDDLLLIANDPSASTWLPGVAVHADLRPGHGAMGGLHAALHHAGTSVLVVAWDMPWVPGALLQRLRSLGTGADAALPWSPGPRGIEPLCAWYAHACLPAVTRRLDAGEREMVGLYSDVRTRILPEADVRAFGDPAHLFLNINTPEELARADAQAGTS